MRPLLTFFLFMIVMASKVVFADHCPDEPRLLCDYANNEFRVGNGSWTKTKYVGSRANSLVHLSCGTGTAAGIFESYFVFFDGASFHEKYVGISSDETRLAVAAGRDTAGAIMGSYFVAAGQSGKIVDKYIGTSSSEKKNKIVASQGIIAAIMGSYFVVYTESGIESKYIGLSDDETHFSVAAGQGIAAAVMGSYFVTYAESQIKSKYIGLSSSDQARIVGSGKLVAASMGSYFLVLDGIRGTISDKYVGQPGNLNILGDAAILTLPSGSVARYSLVTGRFE